MTKYYVFGSTPPPPLPQAHLVPPPGPPYTSYIYIYIMYIHIYARDKVPTGGTPVRIRPVFPAEVTPATPASRARSRRARRGRRALRKKRGAVWPKAQCLPKTLPSAKPSLRKKKKIGRWLGIKFRSWFYYHGFEGGGYEGYADFGPLCN